MITAVAFMLASICLRHVSHHRAAVSPPEVPLKHPVVEPDPLVIAAQTCRYKPDVRLLLGMLRAQNYTSRAGETGRKRRDGVRETLSALLVHGNAV